jgi:hypothetical protein
LPKIIAAGSGGSSANSTPAGPSVLSGTSPRAAEAVAFERVVVGVAPAVRPYAELRSERMGGVDAAMGREEVVARGDEHAAGERQVQLRPLPVLVGRELRGQACVAELAGDA